MLWNTLTSQLAVFKVPFGVSVSLPQVAALHSLEHQADRLCAALQAVYGFHTKRGEGYRCSFVKTLRFRCVRSRAVVVDCHPSSVTSMIFFPFSNSRRMANVAHASCSSVWKEGPPPPYLGLLPTPEISTKSRSNRQTNCHVIETVRVRDVPQQRNERTPGPRYMWCPDAPPTRGITYFGCDCALLLPRDINLKRSGVVRFVMLLLKG